MRRFLITAGALAFVLAAVLAGIAVSVRLAPERLRTELQAFLAREVGPIEVDVIRPHFGWGLGVELAGVRLAAGSGEGALTADRVWLTVSARSLLRGAPRVGRIDVRGLALDVVERADGSLAPALLERARGAAGPGAREAASPTADLRTRASELPALAIDDGVLHVTRRDGSLWTLRLSQLSLGRDRLGGAPRLHATGRVEQPDASAGERAADLGSFELAADLGDPPRGSLAVTDLDLGALRAFTPAAWRAAGRVSGVASWSPAVANGAVELELVGLGLRLARADEGEKGAAVSFPSATLRASVATAGARVEARDFEWRSEALAVAGHATLDRAAPTPSLDLELRGGPVAVAMLRELARVATAPRSASRSNVEALAAGRVTAFSIRTTALPLGGGQPSTSSKTRTKAPAGDLGWTRNVAVEATLEGVELRAAKGEPIQDLGGKFRLEGEQLSIEDAHARLGDRALPGLTLRVDGISAVRAALDQGAPLPPVPPLPGRIALDHWIDSLKRPGSPPRWRKIDVQADWIEHPALLRGLDEVTATLMPANPGVHIRDAKGYWGGVPFRGNGSFYGGDRSRIEADVALTLPRRTGSRRADTEAWGRARFHADLEKLGDFQAESLDGVVQAIGDRVELRRGEARLRPRGDLAGTVDLDLSRDETVPYRARIELTGGSVSDLMNDVKMDGGAARGTAELDADLSGELVAGHNVLADMDGTANLRLRKGQINKRMNVLFVLAQATETLNPFRSRETIPFDTIDAPLQVTKGVANTSALSLQGPALRIVGAGKVDLVHAPNPVEAVIGVFFFRSLDRVIGIFPILNRMLLGPDDNLVSTYFAVAGPWADPGASLIPTKSLASGPASFVLEGLPSFVRGGLSALERVLTRAPSHATPGPAPEAPRADGKS